MRKILAVIFLVILLLSIFGCGSNQSVKPTKVSDANITDRSSLSLAEAIVGVWSWENNPDKQADVSGKPVPTGYFPKYTFYEDGTGIFFSGPQDQRFNYIVDEETGEVIIEVTWSKNDDCFPAKAMLDDTNRVLSIYYDIPEEETSWTDMLVLYWEGVSEPV